VAGLYLGHTTHSGLEDDRDDTLNRLSIMTTFLLNDHRFRFADAE